MVPGVKRALSREPDEVGLEPGVLGAARVGVTDEGAMGAPQAPQKRVSGAVSAWHEGQRSIPGSPGVECHLRRYERCPAYHLLPHAQAPVIDACPDFTLARSLTDILKY
jgi:hypothetical protein